MCGGLILGGFIGHGTALSILFWRKFMEKLHFCNEGERKYALACLEFAKQLGIIDDSSLDAVSARCNSENEKRKAMAERGEVFYGVTHFTPNAYLDYELTRFKLDFAGETPQVKRNYSYKEITRKDKKAFYKNNRDLFTRYNNDRFLFFEVSTVIHKKIREEQYDAEINNILCKLS